MIFMVAAVFALAIWVDTPAANASIQSSADAGSLTVTVKWVSNA